MNTTLGQIAYEAYFQSRDWKSFNGVPLPSFGEMNVKNPDIAEAWEKAAEAVRAHLQIASSPG